jgi:hypothetical protein
VKQRNQAFNRHSALILAVGMLFDAHPQFGLAVFQLNRLFVAVGLGNTPDYAATALSNLCERM